MHTYKRIKSQEEIRRTVKYSNAFLPDSYTDEVLKCGPINQTLMTAERFKTDEKTNSAVPSDIAVENMRDWSIEKKV